MQPFLILKDKKNEMAALFSLLCGHFPLINIHFLIGKCPYYYIILFIMWKFHYI